MNSVIRGPTQILGFCTSFLDTGFYRQLFIAGIEEGKLCHHTRSKDSFRSLALSFYRGDTRDLIQVVRLSSKSLRLLSLLFLFCFVVMRSHVVPVSL